jgi:alpha-galactosidase
LNNWEATYFDFNEDKLIAIMDEAVKLGVDMFLLDDGWFANKYPRSSDRQGLGDWEVTKDKLPNGIKKLVDEATKKGIKFGIWIEPEMVNPKSELYEKHKDWVVQLPNRDAYYFRNQMVLDLSNPKVQDFVFGIVDNLMTRYPGIAYLKWDCNSPITNIFSPYLKDKQSHLYIEHVRGLYAVFERVKQKYPDLPMMLCSGGGGRTDYEALKYFTEFWPSDNTDAVERIFIQWGYSHFFPSKSMAAHVTSWGKQPVKFRTDVAMTCKLGFDIRIHEMKPEEQEFCHDAVKNYKRLESAILDGNMYRLASPYESDHAAILYMEENGKKSVLFTFDLHPRYSEHTQPLRLAGLHPDKKYRLKEINLLPGTNSRLACNGRIYSGDFLMKAGIQVFSSQHTVSHVIEIDEIE